MSFQHFEQVRTSLTDVAVRDAATGVRYHLERDYTIKASSLDASGNWTRLQPFLVQRVANGTISNGRQSHMSTVCVCVCVCVCV